jgi:hypothetical protein
MAELRGLSVKMPIRFNEKAQKDLYETCMAYKELAEVRGAENAKLRELCEGMLVCYEPCNELLDARTDCPLYDDGEPLRCRKARLLRELGIGVKE